MEWVRERFLNADDSGADEFRRLYMSEPFTNDAVYKREEIAAMLERGEISKPQAEEMLRMRYTLNWRGEKVVERV